MSIEQKLAEQMVNENARLREENEELIGLNEGMNSLVNRVDALGGIEAIEQKINQINESRVLQDGEEEILESFTNIVENYGGLEAIEETLNSHNSFIEQYGSLEDVSEALAESKTHLTKLSNFVKVHGSLEEVSESMSALEQRMPSIEEGLKSANRAEEFFNEYGSPEEISEALTRAAALLGAKVDEINEAKLSEVCESFGITAEKAHDLMEKHSLDMSGLADLCESLGMKPKDPAEKLEDIQEHRTPSTRPTCGLMKSMVSGSSFLKRDSAEDISESVDEDQPQKQPRHSSRFSRMIS
ncbi:hypothetical protein [Vibrio phage Va2]|nr:hypothetical protein [Vibrio phage Va2]